MNGKYRLRLDKNLRFLLLKNGLSVATLCRRLKCSSKTVYAYTYGVAPKNIQCVQEIADYFGVSLTSLLFDNFEQLEASLAIEEPKKLSIEIAFLVKHETNGKVIMEERKVLLHR